MCSVTVQLLKSADLGRQSLLYLKEIGHGWFGKVSMGHWGVGCWDTGAGCMQDLVPLGLLQLLCPIGMWVAGVTVSPTGSEVR